MSEMWKNGLEKLGKKILLKMKHPNSYLAK